MHHTTGDGKIDLEEFIAVCGGERIFAANAARVQQTTGAKRGHELPGAVAITGLAPRSAPGPPAGIRALPLTTVGLIFPVADQTRCSHDFSTLIFARGVVAACCRRCRCFRTWEGTTGTACCAWTAGKAPSWIWPTASTRSTASTWPPTAS